MFKSQGKVEKRPSTRMMRVGDELIVKKEKHRTSFQIQGRDNAFAAPAFGITIRLLGGPHSGAEGKFCIIWLTHSERLSGFWFPDIGVLLHEQLAEGQTLAVIEM